MVIRLVQASMDGVQVSGQYSVDQVMEERLGEFRSNNAILGRSHPKPPVVQCHLKKAKEKDGSTKTTLVKNRNQERKKREKGLSNQPRSLSIHVPTNLIKGGM